MHPRSLSEVEGNTKMLLLEHTDSNGSEESEIGLVTTGQSKTCKRFKSSVNDKYDEHTVVQHGCSRGPTLL